MQSFDDIEVEIIKRKTEYEKLCELLSYEEVLLDKKLYLHLNKQKQILKPLIDKFDSYLESLNNLKELEDIIKISNETEKKVFKKDIDKETKKIDLLKEDIKKDYFLLSSQTQEILVEIAKENDNLSCRLFDILVQGYENFCKKNNFKFNLKIDNKCAIINIIGLNAKSYFEDEIGNHCIKNSLKNGFCFVFVYNGKFNNDFNFDEKELKFLTCRSSGAGGQHINTTDSAIKIIHLPTGIFAVSQDERSQFQNKQKALERVKEKVENFLIQQKNDFIKEQKKEQMKKFKNCNYIKIYDLDNSTITTYKKQQILLEDFLSGNTLN